MVDETLAKEKQKQELIPKVEIINFPNLGSWRFQLFFDSKLDKRSPILIIFGFIYLQQTQNDKVHSDQVQNYFQQIRLHHQQQLEFYGQFP